MLNGQVTSRRWFGRPQRVIAGAATSAAGRLPSPITSAGLVHLGGLRLMDLDLDDTRVESLEPLKDLTTLRSLSLNRTPINDVGLARVAGFRNLESLVLSRTRISDAGLASLAGLPNLNFLSLIRTQVSDAGLASLVSLPKLFMLDLNEGFPDTHDRRRLHFRRVSRHPASWLAISVSRWVSGFL
jgi:hypothetical protein